MKQLVALVLGLFISFLIYGQASSSLNKVTLNSGEVYIGEIVVKTNELIMIKAKNGTRYQFQLKDVKEISAVTATEAADNNTSKAKTPLTVDGNFSGQLEVIGGISSAKNAFTSSPNGQISLAFGSKKAFGKDCFLGLGAGYNTVYVPSGSTIALFPVFVRIQSLLSKEKIAPFIGMDVGYAFATTTNFKGGALAKISGGISHRLSYKNSLTAGVFVGINQLYGDIEETNELGTFTYKGNVTMLNAGIKLGLQF